MVFSLTIIGSSEFTEDKKIRAIFNKRPFITQKALLLVFLSLILLLLDSHARFTQPLRYHLQAIVYPLEYTANLPWLMAHKIKNNFLTHHDLIKKNAELQSQIALLQLKQQRFIDLENENKQLRALLKATSSDAFKSTLADVLFISSYNEYSSQWVLNKGLEEGVFIGQAVLDEQGVVGQVVMLGPHMSRVMLINDIKSSIPVENARSGLRSILQGNGSGKNLSLMFIPKSEEVLVGDILLSSGVGDIFPKGYPVGQVVSVNNEVEDPFLSVKVLPFSSLKNKSFVILIGMDHA